MQSAGSKGAIFDLDGVLVDTARFHLSAWRSLAEELDIALPAEFGESVKGVSRAAALELVLAEGDTTLTPERAKAATERKNALYLTSIGALDESALLPGAARALELLTERGVPIALASASRNARGILDATGITPYFSAIIDGTTITRAKPAPDVFLAACSAIGLAPSDCTVFEDAEAGVAGAREAGCRVVGIGDVKILAAADAVVPSLSAVDWQTEVPGSSRKVRKR